jgi:hypothetical protein
MKFPVLVKNRKPEAVIYGQTPGYPSDRLAYRAGGKRRIRSIATRTRAREAAGLRCSAPLFHRGVEGCLDGFMTLVCPHERR